MRLVRWDDRWADQGVRNQPVCDGQKSVHMGDIWAKELLEEVILSVHNCAVSANCDLQVTSTDSRQCDHGT